MTRGTEAAQRSDRTLVASSWADDVVETSYGSISVRQSVGSGLPILWIHDLSEDKTIFSSQFESALARGHRLIGLDLPGHGLSSDPLDPALCSMLDFADAVIEVAELLGIDRAVVVGRGHGARIAMCIAASWPGIAAVYGIGALPVLRWAAAAQGQHLSPSLQSSMLSFVGASSIERTAMRTNAAEPLFVPLARSRPFADLDYERSVQSASSVRVALVAGAADPLVEKIAMEPISYSGLWRGTCQYVPDCGSDLAQQAIVADLLGSFLGDLAAEGDAEPWLCLSA